MKVLVADDSLTIRMLMEEILVRYGYEVVLATDGNEAWRIIPEPGAPRIVILDWMMPGLDGIELCRHIRLLPETDYRYILLMTSRDSKDDIVEGLEAGADDYLIKPVNASELHARLRSAKRILSLQQRLITEHDTLANEKEKIRLLLDSTAEGIMGVDNDSNCTFSNRAALEHLGYESEAELVGQNIHQAIHHSYPDGRPYPLEACRFLKSFRQHEAAHFDGEHFWRKDGTSFPVEYWSHPIVRGDVYLGAVVAFWNATKRILAEKAQRQSEELFKSIAENTMDLIAVVAPNFRRIYTNPSFSRILGYTSEELEGANSLDTVHPDDREKVKQARGEALRTGVGQVLEHRMLRKDGSYITIESHSSFIRNSQGETEALLVSARDVGQRKLAEHAQKMEAIGQLAAGIAHEINTPVQYVSDNLAFLGKAWQQLGPVVEGSLSGQVASGARPQGDRPVLSPKAAEEILWLSSEVPNAIHQSLEGTKRISKIVSAMRKFSHSGTGEMCLVDINDALETTITVAHNEIKHITQVETDFQANLPAVVCMPGEMNQVFLNLIVNAAHAIADGITRGTTQKGAMLVRTLAVDNGVQVEVHDNGAGIPEAVRHRIFEPFFTTKPVGKGTGQGLTICHDIIVNKHKGQIWFETEAGRGTTFFLCIPMAQQAASAGAV